MLESLAVDLLRKSVTVRAREAFGWSLVEYGRPFKFLALAGWGVAVGAAALAGIHPDEGSVEGGAVTAGISLVALLLHIEFFHTHIAFNGSGIQPDSIWRGRRFYGWSDVLRLDFQPGSQQYVVRLRNGGKFTFNPFMSGYGSLLHEIERRLLSTKDRR